MPRPYSWRKTRPAVPAPIRNRLLGAFAPGVGLRRRLFQRLAKADHWPQAITVDFSQLCRRGAKYGNEEREKPGYFIITVLQKLGVPIDAQSCSRSLRDPEAAIRRSLGKVLEHLEDESALAMLVETMAESMTPEAQVAFIKNGQKPVFLRKRVSVIHPPEEGRTFPGARPSPGG